MRPLTYALLRPLPLLTSASGRYPSPLNDATTSFNIIGSLMSAQLEHSKVSRQNTTLFVSLYNVTLSLPFRFISVSALPPLSFVASVSCIVNGQSLSGSSLTASRPHHDHLVIEFASAVIPNISTVVCAVGVQFAGGSASKTVGITTDMETPSRGLSNTTVDVSHIQIS